MKPYYKGYILQDQRCRLCRQWRAIQGVIKTLKQVLLIYLLYLGLFFTASATIAVIKVIFRGCVRSSLFCLLPHGLNSRHRQVRTLISMFPVLRWDGMSSLNVSVLALGTPKKRKYVYLHFRTQKNKNLLIYLHTKIISTCWWAAKLDVDCSRIWD